MSYSDQQRAVVEALGLSADDLRGLAGALESGQRIVSVGEVAAAHLATLPDHHRYAKSLQRVILWAGDDDAAAVQPADVTGWALRAGREARTDAKARHGVGAQEAMILATRAAFAHAIESGLIRHNPACQVALPDLRPRVGVPSAPTNSRRCTSRSWPTHAIPNLMTSSSASCARRAVEGTAPSG